LTAQLTSIDSFENAILGLVKKIESRSPKLFELDMSCDRIPQKVTMNLEKSTTTIQKAKKINKCS
jgi:hypothetical protein